MIYTVEQIKDAIKPIAEKYKIPKVYLFGSYARGEADEESDIDFAYDYDNSNLCGLFDCFKLENDVKSKFHKPVDLLSFGEIYHKTRFENRLAKTFDRDKVKLYEV